MCVESRGFSLVSMHELLLVVAPLVAECRLQSLGSVAVAPGL